MHTVAVVALDDVVPFDLAVPIEVFGRAIGPGGERLYDVRVCAPGPVVRAGLFSMQVPETLDVLAQADTIVIPGVADLASATPPELLAALRTSPARLVSICAGAFTLAAAGVLDGLRATTHWVATAELARRHPAVRVEPDVLFTDEGRVLTSAGAAAGLDLCLHIVRRDHGAAVAAQAARLNVMPLERSGGQAQFIVHEQAPAESLAALLDWLTGHLDRPLTLAVIAAQAALSPRTLSRHFRAQTGTTPMQWLARQRIRRAQQLLEETDHPVERIGAMTGFASATAFRERFREAVSTSPRDYRRAFRR